MSGLRMVQLDVDCPVCEVQALTGQRTPHGPCRRVAGVRRRRARVLALYAWWGRFWSSLPGCVVGCCLFVGGLWALLVLFPDGLHS